MGYIGENLIDLDPKSESEEGKEGFAGSPDPPAMKTDSDVVNRHNANTETSSAPEGPSTHSTPSALTGTAATAATAPGDINDVFATWAIDTFEDVRRAVREYDGVLLGLVTETETKTTPHVAWATNKRWEEHTEWFAVSIKSRESVILTQAWAEDLRRYGKSFATSHSTEPDERKRWDHFRNEAERLARERAVISLRGKGRFRYRVFTPLEASVYRQAVAFSQAEASGLSIFPSQRRSRWW